jgi:hypothetical protein
MSQNYFEYKTILKRQLRIPWPSPLQPGFIIDEEIRDMTCIQRTTMTRTVAPPSRAPPDPSRRAALPSRVIPATLRRYIVPY